MLRVNEYFQGKVKSISFQGMDAPATVGVISPGEYVFSTSQKEVMTVISGNLEVKLKDAREFEIYSKNQSFIVPAGESFSVRAKEDVSYLCLYY